MQYAADTWLMGKLLIIGSGKSVQMYSSSALFLYGFGQGTRTLNLGINSPTLNHAFTATPFIRCFVKCCLNLENKNSHKLMGEYEKYNELQAKYQKMQEEYERQLQIADTGKQHSLEELTEYYETRLQEKSSLLEQVQSPEMLKYTIDSVSIQVLWYDSILRQKRLSS